MSLDATVVGYAARRDEFPETVAHAPRPPGDLPVLLFALCARSAIGNPFI